MILLKQRACLSLALRASASVSEIDQTEPPGQEQAAPSPSTVLLAGALLLRREIGLARRASEVGLLVHGVSVAVKLFLFPSSSSC